jgi:hypothetical protein
MRAPYSARAGHAIAREPWAACGELRGVAGRGEVCRGIETGMTELLDAANGSPSARPKTRPRRTPVAAW